MQTTKIRNKLRGISSNYIMARNTGENYRKGAVKERSQVFNPSTGNWIKRDTVSGQFLEVKRSEPFKGVRKESQSRVRSHPLVSKSLARKVEKAVLSVKNK